jgi:integrase/recombinase XerD
MTATQPSIREHAEQYLAMRRALGFKLTVFGTRLLGFVGYLETHDLSVITADAALAWATTTPRSRDEVHWSRRLMVARIFARHMAVLDPATEVPPPDVLPHHYRRVTPHLFTDTQIAALMDAASMLRPALRARTWQTLIGLLVVSGLRDGEACRLDDGDLEDDDDSNHDAAGAGGLLTIRNSKHGKTRQVPIHASTLAALRDYQQERDRVFPAPRTPALLVTTRGTRLDANISRTFADLVRAVAIATPAGGRPPRLADFRHSFCTATLLDWYRDGQDVQARMPVLSTFLGHADPKSTFWYLTGTPELLALAAARFEHVFGVGDA